LREDEMTTNELDSIKRILLKCPSVTMKGVTWFNVSTVDRSQCEGCEKFLNEGIIVRHPEIKNLYRFRADEK